MEGRKGRQASGHEAKLKYLAQVMWKDFKQETVKIRLKECYWRDREISSNYFSQKYTTARAKRGLVKMGHSLGLWWKRGCCDGRRSRASWATELSPLNKISSGSLQAAYQTSDEETEAQGRLAGELGLLNESQTGVITHSFALGWPYLLPFSTLSVTCGNEWQQYSWEHLYKIHTDCTFTITLAFCHDTF